MTQSAWRIGVPVVTLVVLATIIYFFGIKPFREINALKGSLEPKDFLQLRSNALTGVAQALGGAILLTGLFFTWRSVKATEAGIRATQESTAKSLTIAQEGQITERFTRAIEQLGNKESLSTRLGGIYALERIATDSERDHWPVMEILTTYIRENAASEEEANGSAEPLPQEEAAGIVPAVPVPPWEQEHARPIPALAKDIQAILTVLGRRNISHETGKDRYLDLEKSDLANANLALAHLESAIFYGVHLEDAVLRCAHLEGARFTGAHLEAADFSDADLARASFSMSYSRGAVFNIARAKQADFTSDRLNKAYFFYADLQRASFRHAKLKDAHFENANLEGADFKGADLTDAKFTGANLTQAHLTEAEGLTIKQIKSARGYESVKLPRPLAIAIERVNN